MPRFLMIVGLLATASHPAHSNIFRVPSDFPTIALAANSAFPGDTVLVAPGTYSDWVWIDKSLTLPASCIRTCLIT
jgi:hypothetical protein